MNKLTQKFLDWMFGPDPKYGWWIILGQLAILAGLLYLGGC